MTRGPLPRALLVLVAGGAITAAFSCKTFDLPAETCNPTSLSSENAPTDCDRCMEDHCCDAVGVCERTDGCAAIVSQTQKCILDVGLQGASSEKSCAELSTLTQKKDGGIDLEHPEADGAYRCMRSSCGTQCGLPVCQVDQAARLILNPPCDQCFAGACCTELNRCYENRACKLTLECIISSCGPTLGSALRDVNAGPPDAGVGDPAAVAALCADSAPHTGLPECVRSCLCAYRGNDLGLPPSGDALSPIALASSVYSCGRTAKCGDACSAGVADASAD
jgi:hypothetical protein